MSTGSGEAAAAVPVCPEVNTAPGWPDLAAALEAARAVGAGLVRFLAQHGGAARKAGEGGPGGGGARYKVSMCRDLALRGSCPRGANCTFAHSEEELER